MMILPCRRTAGLVMLMTGALCTARMAAGKRVGACAKSSDKKDWFLVAEEARGARFQNDIGTLG